MPFFKMLLVCGICSVTIALAPASLLADSRVVRRDYAFDVEFMSLVPGAGLDSYRPKGSFGGSGFNNALDFHIKGVDCNFEVSFVFQSNEKQAYMDFTVTPDESDLLTQKLKERVDLTNLHPHTRELARDQDGRIYQMVIKPRIVETLGPVPFRARDFWLENLSCQNSQVILNDKDYLGEIAASQGAKVFFEAPGVANVELSLLHLKDAEPLGVLDNGTITIQKGDQSIKISNVRNGAHPEVLRGGPFRVWVRWTEARSLEEYRRQVAEMTAEMKRKVDAGEVLMRPEVLERLEAMSKDKSSRLMTCGVSSVSASELVSE